MPPVQTTNKPDANPYDFIINEPPKQPKPSLLSSQTSFKQRLLVILGGGLVLIIVIVVISSLFSSKPKTTGLLAIAQQQTALITVATSATTTASQQITKNLATNVELSLTSAQLSVISYLKSAGSNPTATSLLSSQTTVLSKELASTPANNFDSVYAGLTQTQLSSYASTIKSVYSSSDPASLKLLLSNLYVSANLLLKEATTTTTSL